MKARSIVHRDVTEGTEFGRFLLYLKDTVGLLILTIGWSGCDYRCHLRSSSCFMDDLRMPIIPQQKEEAGNSAQHHAQLL
jgi:hypothetical protein